MELRHLRYFMIVAEELNLSRAAQRLGTSQPSLGQQMRALEADIGVTLFERDKHRMSLTEAGRVLCGEATALLEKLDESLRLVRAAGRGEVGAVRIGTSPSSDVKVLPILLPRLRKDFPEMEFNLRSLASRAELIEALLERRIDVAFLRGPVTEDGLVSFFILRERFVIALPASHPLAKRQKLKLEELNEMPFLTNPPVNISENLLSALKASGIRDLTPHLAWDTRNANIDLQVVGSGLGFTILPDYACQIAPASCAIVEIDAEKPFEIDLLVAYRRDNRSPMLNFLLATLRQCFPLIG